MCKNEINIDIFKKLDIRIGKIISVESIERSTKLYKILIDLNEKSPIQIVSGLKTYYKSFDLIGKHVCVLTNIVPITLCCVQSNGIILASESDNKEVSLLVPDKNIAIGSKIC